MRKIFFLYVGCSLINSVAMENCSRVTKRKAPAELTTHLKVLLQTEPLSWQEIKEVIEHGAAIDTQTENGNESAITRAARSNNGEMVTFLLQHGADPNRKNYQKNSALRMASLLGHATIVRLFIAAGVDLDIRDNDENTPLMWAVLLSDPAIKIEIVNLLLEGGADRYSVDREGNNLLTIAKGDQAITDLLTKKIKIH